MKIPFINEEFLISKYDIWERSANPNWRGGDRHILFIKGKKYRSSLGGLFIDPEIEWVGENEKYTYTITIVGERGIQCHFNFIENDFVGEIHFSDKNYSTINCFKDGQEIFPFETLEDYRDRKIEKLIK